jgi:membrane associated rhomboid family serine protease
MLQFSRAPQSCQAFPIIDTARSATKLLPLSRRRGYPFSFRLRDDQAARDVLLQMHKWEGDDLRWSTRFRRRLRRRSSEGDDTPAKTVFFAVNFFLFLYQTVTTVNYIRHRHPSYWPTHALGMITDAVVGSSVLGPLSKDFGFSNFLSRNQPHRYLTSGFFHGGLIHLLVNMDTLRRQASWLETGLGVPLYLTTFLVSIVAGNVGHLIGANNPFDQTLVLGASGGICGLYGLMYVSLIKMGNRGATRRIARGMGTMILAGLFIENMSGASHFGGFLGGVVMAILFAPSYKGNYSMRRKNSAEYDPAPRDFRQAMGFGVMPTERGMIPLPLLWGALAVLYVVAKPKFRAMPALVIKGILFPGSLTS